MTGLLITFAVVALVGLLLHQGFARYHHYGKIFPNHRVRAAALMRSALVLATLEPESILLPENLRYRITRWLNDGEQSNYSMLDVRGSDSEAMKIIRELVTPKDLDGEFALLPPRLHNRCQRWLADRRKVALR